MLDTIRERLLNQWSAKIDSEARAELAIRHAAAVQRLADLKRDHAAETTKLRAGVTQATERADKARAAFERATQAQREAAFALRTVQLTFDRASGELERELLETADPRIAEAERTLEAKWTEVRNHAPRHEAMPARPDAIGAQLRYRSNQHAFPVIARAVSQARSAFRGLALQHVDDLPAALVAIEASIPWGLTDVLRED